MDYDVAKLDEIVLALLYLNAFTDGGATRAWKSFDWDSLNRLHPRGLIADPKSKAKSVVLTEEGTRLGEELFKGTLGRPYNRPLQPPGAAGEVSRLPERLEVSQVPLLPCGAFVGYELRDHR